MKHSLYFISFLSASAFWISRQGQIPASHGKSKEQAGVIIMLHQAEIISHV